MSTRFAANIHWVTVLGKQKEFVAARELYPDTQGAEECPVVCKLQLRNRRWCWRTSFPEGVPDVERRFIRDQQRSAFYLRYHRLIDLMQ
jgi:hypothetical protein